MNIAEIEMQLSDLVNEPFDQSEFVFKFIEIFTPPKATRRILIPDGPILREGYNSNDSPIPDTNAYFWWRVDFEDWPHWVVA